MSNIDDLSPSEMKKLEKEVRAYIKGSGKSQVGEGVFKNILKKIRNARKKVVKKAVDKGKEVVKKGVEKAAGCKNKKKGMPWDYKKLPNESKHQSFMVDGCVYSAYWSGPGTQVLPKIEYLYNKHNGDFSKAVKSDQFVHPVDRQAAAHDIRYLLAGDESDKDKKYQMIRSADEKFISRLKKMKSEANVLVPLRAMQAKVLFEKAGGKQYSGSEPFKNDEQRKRAKSLLAALEQVGEGKVFSRLKKKKEENKDPRMSPTLSEGLSPNQSRTVSPTNIDFSISKKEKEEYDKLADDIVANNDDNKSNDEELMQINALYNRIIEDRKKRSARQYNVEAINKKDKERLKRAVNKVYHKTDISGNVTKGKGKKKKFDILIDAIQGSGLYLTEAHPDDQVGNGTCKKCKELIEE